MNEKKQGKFKIGYVLVLLVVVLLFSLLLIDFGENGKRLTFDQALSVIQSETYKDDKGETQTVDVQKRQGLYRCGWLKNSTKSNAFIFGFLF